MFGINIKLGSLPRLYLPAVLTYPRSSSATLIMFSKRVYTAVAALFWLAEPATCSPCCNKLPASTYKLAVDNYLKAWNGENKEIVPKSFTKFALLSGDRLLNGTSPSFSPYPIVTSDGISQFMDMARVGWDKYQFELIHWAGGIDNTAAVRWTLHGVLGKDYQAKAEM